MSPPSADEYAELLRLRLSDQLSMLILNGYLGLDILNGYLGLDCEPGCWMTLHDATKRRFDVRVEVHVNELPGLTSELPWVTPETTT